MPKVRFLIWGSSAVYGILLLGQRSCIFSQYNLQDMLLQVNSYPTLIWIMPCVSKFSCTHGIIISLCLICYIQCRFSIACLSIPGIAASDRCKISNSFTFSFQFQSPAVLFIYIAVFWEDLKRLGEIGERKWCEIIFICSKISLFNFSGYLFLMTGIYCDCCY